MSNPDDPRPAPKLPQPSLLQRAEARLEPLDTGETDDLTPEASARLIHDLRVQQIELELQNEDLRCAQEALEVSRARYFDLYDLAPVGYLTLSEAGLIQEVNLTAASLLEAPRGRLVGQPLSRLILTEDREIHDRCRHRLWSTGKPQSCELRLPRADGEPRWVHLAASLAPEENRRQSRVILSDISERRQFEERRLNEEALRRANLHNRALLEASLDPLVVIDPEGRISDVNSATEQATGYRREQLIGTDFSGYFSDPEQARAGYRAVFDQGQVRDYALELLHRDGHATPVLYNASVYRDHEGAVEQVFAGARDVTKLKRLTEMLQARLRLLNSADTSSLDEVLRASVDEATHLTGSVIGFYHFLEPDQETLILQTWSTRTTREFCSAEGTGRHYPLSEAGVWADCVRQRRAIIHNDYAALPQRHGLPEGHAQVIRELVTPVLRGEQIVAILGVGNKPSDYGEEDLQIVSAFADLAWEIIERKRAQNALSESEARYRRIVETTNEGIWVMDARHLMTFVNPRMAALLGYASADMLGRPIEHFMFAEDLEAHQERMQARHLGQNEAYERRYRRKDGSELWTLVSAVALFDEAQGFSGSFAMLTDISLIKEQQRRLEQMAHFDPLTGLPNRALLADRLRIALAHARREERLLAVCYLDLDDFKPVNDTHGHAAGDRLLVAIAGRLTQSVREDDTVARLGGDEFVLLLGNLASRDECAQMLERLLLAVAQPYPLDPSTTVEVSASIGVTIYPLDQTDADTLLRHADLAMYQAKQDGRNCFRLLDAVFFT
jgi:diguanylate cyclase (GGDEF)-like protein/PAS domain S-box-containing protein